MELRRFQQFITLAEEGSFTAAAAKLYMAQSSLSESIAALERDLGVQVVTRSRGGIQLTDAGRAFLAPARKTVAEAHEAKQAALGLQVAAPPLRIGNTFVSSGLQAELAAQALHVRQAELTIQITHFGLRNISDRVAAGELDVAFTPVREPLPSSVLQVPLFEIPLVVLCSPAHRLAGSHSIEPNDLGGEVLIVVAGESIVDDPTLDKYLTESSHGPVQVVAGSWLNAVSLARRGFGIAIGPEFGADYYPPDVAIGHFARQPLLRAAIVTPPEDDQHPALPEYLALYRALVSAG